MSTHIPPYESLYDWFTNINKTPNYLSLIIPGRRTNLIIRNLTLLSTELTKSQPFYSKRLFTLKDSLFIGCGNINPFVFGQIYEILQHLNYIKNNPPEDIWYLVHPQIAAVSQNLFLDGYFAEAAENAFKEINSRVKKLYHILDNTTPAPDGKSVMNKVFSPDHPLIELCDRSTDSGKNIQLGFKEMLSGSISALRNPKAHENVQITSSDAMRQIIFASMLMYKIDEGVSYSNVNEI